MSLNIFSRKQSLPTFKHLAYNHQRYYFSKAYGIENYYSLLGVQTSASQEEIKQAYFKKAKDLHPDTALEKQTLEIQDTFKKMTQAYNVLKDPQMRSQYDFDHYIFTKQSNENFNRGYTQHPTRNEYRYDWYKDQYQQEGYHYNDNHYGFNNNYTYNKARYSSQHSEFYKDYDEWIRKGGYNNQNNQDSRTNSSSYSSGFKSETMNQPAWKRWKLHWIGALLIFISVENWLEVRNELNMTEKEIDEKLKELKASQKQKDAEVRRENLTLSKQTVINDPPHVQEKRRKEFEKELADQQVKIEVSYFDTTQNPYMSIKDKVRKFKDKQDFYSGQNALLEYAKNEKMSIQKSPDALEKAGKYVKPKRITATQIAQLAEGEDI